MSRRRWAVAALVLGGPTLGIAALAGSPAGAQVQLGGSVPDLIALSIGTPSGFVRVAGGAYELRIPVAVTSTDQETSLSVGDGQDFKAPARGHLHDGAHLVAAPLEVSVAGRSAQALSAPTDPFLETWFQPLTRAPVTIVVRQALPHGSITAPSLSKVVLITVSSQTP